MATSRKYRTEDYPPCRKCGRSIENMSRAEQDAHEDYHKRQDIESGKQTTLI